MCMSPETLFLSPPCQRGVAPKVTGWFMGSVIADLAPLLDRQRANDRLLDHDAGLGSPEAVCRALGQQCLVPALQADAAHALALRLTLHLHRAFLSRRRDGFRIVELHVLDLDLAVHDHCELIV